MVLLLTLHAYSPLELNQQDLELYTWVEHLCYHKLPPFLLLLIVLLILPIRIYDFVLGILLEGIIFDFFLNIPHDESTQNAHTFY